MLLHALVLLPNVLLAPIVLVTVGTVPPVAVLLLVPVVMETRVLLLALECTCSETPSHASNLVLLLALVLLAPVALVAPVLPLEFALTTEALLVPAARGEAERREERRETEAGDGEERGGHYAPLGCAS